MEEIDNRHVVLQAAGECMSPDQYEAIEALISNDPGVFQRFLSCINKRVTPGALQALQDLLGPENDPNIGWRGHAKTSNDHFRCEHCGAEDLDCVKMKHKDSCLVVKARIALAKAQGAQQ